MERNVFWHNLIKNQVAAAFTRDMDLPFRIEVREQMEDNPLLFFVTVTEDSNRTPVWDETMYPGEEFEGGLIQIRVGDHIETINVDFTASEALKENTNEAAA
jgi:hypothetical protein